MGMSNKFCVCVCVCVPCTHLHIFNFLIRQPHQAKFPGLAMNFAQTVVHLWYAESKVKFTQGLQIVYTWEPTSLFILTLFTFHAKYANMPSCTLRV